MPEPGNPGNVQGAGNSDTSHAGECGMAFPLGSTITAGVKLIEIILRRIPGGPRTSPQRDALIAALIASIPILTKELIPVIIESVRSLGRRPKTYHADGSDVCHLYEDCTVGEKIIPEFRKRGTGDKKLCIQCRDKMLGI